MFLKTFRQELSQNIWQPPLVANEKIQSPSEK
jgi:hypothetical protein